MKKTVFVCLSVIVGIIAFLFTFFAAVLAPQDGSRLIDVCLLSYLGVIVPNVVLEMAKYLCFKQDYKKIYAFDIIGVFISLSVLVILNLLIWGESFFVIFMEEFFLYQLPWLLIFLAYGLLFVFKSKKTKI